MLRQVVWWSTLSEKFREEVAAQSTVFGGEHGQQRHTDFRSAPTALYSSVFVTLGCVLADKHMF